MKQIILVDLGIEMESEKFDAQIKTFIEAEMKDSMDKLMERVNQSTSMTSVRINGAEIHRIQISK